MAAIPTVREHTRAPRRTFYALAEPLEDIVAQNRLREIPGVGDAIADIVTKLHRTGRHPALDAMRTEIPAGTLELLTVPGLRPDKALKLYKELGISSVEDLEQAAKQEQLKNVKGLGSALQSKILQGIEIKRRSEGLRHLHRAAALLELAQAQLMRSRPGVSRITPAGDFRRGCELIGDLSLVAQVSDAHGAVCKEEDQSQLALHLTDKQRYGAALLLATGSQKHLKELRELAAARGMTLDKDGLRKGDKIIAGKSEEEIYRALGLPFIEPELREGRGEITLAQKGKLPTLVTDADLRGILHAHTDRSDGVDTLEAMAEATRERGYSYFGVADHSRSSRLSRTGEIDKTDGIATLVGLRSCYARHAYSDIGLRAFQGRARHCIRDLSADSANCSISGREGIFVRRVGDKTSVEIFCGAGRFT